MGALHAVLLAAKYFPKFRPSRVVIKGDNRPVIDFMTHTGKFRRPDLQRLLSDAQHALAFRLPPVHWVSPREFNQCADFLAGVARDFAKQSPSATFQPIGSLEPFPFPLPPSLASLNGLSRPAPLDLQATCFTFPEIVSLKPSYLPLLFRQAHRSPPVLRYLRSLVKGSHTLSCLSIPYRPSAPDCRGRLYPSTVGAQKLPRSFRSLLFGSTHSEIDLVGSHYQLFQRLSSVYLGVTLPSVLELHTLIRDDIRTLLPPLSSSLSRAPKDLLTILLNSPLEATINRFRQSQPVSAAMRSISRTKSPLSEVLDSRLGPRTLPSLTLANRPFHTLEHPETLCLKSFVSYISHHFAIDSLIWLHDGIWIAPLPGAAILQAANRHASEIIGLLDPLELRITACSKEYEESFSTLLRGVPLPILPSPITAVEATAPSPTVPFAQPAAKAAFQRMLLNNALPRGPIIVDD